MNRSWRCLWALGVLLAGASYTLAAAPGPASARAVAAIERLGGRVAVDENLPGKPVVEVDFLGTKVNDAALVHIRQLPDLTSVILSGTRVTDAGLEHLRGLARLENLSLNHTKISGAGLARLAGLPRLHCLVLYGTRITDAGLEHLRALPALEELELSDTRVTDAGLARLRQSPRLESLGLERTAVSDAGLPKLIGAHKLTYLFLRMSRVTAEGVEDFQQEMPTCIVDWKPPGAPPSQSRPADVDGDEGENALPKDEPSRIQTLRTHKDPARRRDAAAALGDQHLGLSKTVTQPLVDAFQHDKDEGVRIAALSSLWNGCSTEHVPWPALVAAMRSGSPRMHVLAAAAIDQKLGGHEDGQEAADWMQEPLLAKLSQDKDSAVRGLFALAVGRKSADRKAAANAVAVFICSKIQCDDDLRLLCGLEKLSSLSLIGAKIEGRGLVHLSRLRRLQTLYLPQTLTDRGLTHLSGLTSLTSLFLWNSQVTDAGLKHLAGLTELEWLALSDTKVTDVGLEHLAGLTKLGFLQLTGTKVTEQGVARLKKALPKCGVSWESSNAASRPASKVAKRGTLSLDEWFRTSWDRDLDVWACIERLGDDDPAARALAARSLRDRGADAAAALPALHEAAKDSDKSVARDVAEAIALIRLAMIRVDDDLKPLADLDKLEYLFLDEKNLTGRALTHINRLAGLRRLSLPRAATNADLAHLARLVNLDWLSLENTQVTDAGLERLAGLAKLETLVLTGTKVTERGVARLRDALPRCEIEWNRPETKWSILIPGGSCLSCATGHGQGFGASPRRSCGRATTGWVD